MTTDAGRRMNQVTLSVTDVLCAKRFYCGLGSMQIVDGDDYVRLVAPGNEATLSLHRAGEAVPTIAPPTVGLTHKRRGWGGEFRCAGS